jgi:WD40 repeat protein
MVGLLLARRAFVFSGGQDESARVWNVATGKEEARLSFSRRPDDVVATAWTSASVAEPRLLAGTENGSVFLWDAATGKELFRLAGHRGPVYSVAFSTDGVYAATGGRDGTIRVWDTRGGDQLRLIEWPEGSTVSSVQFSTGKRSAQNSRRWPGLDLPALGRSKRGGIDQALRA